MRQQLTGSPEALSNRWSGGDTLNQDRTASKLPVFLIIDYTGDMWQYVHSVEQHLRDLVARLRRDGIWSRLEFSLVGMGGKTGVVKIEDVVGGQSGRLARQLPVCDLGTALALVVKALTGPTHYGTKGEVFVILGSNPGKLKWDEYAQTLGELGVNVTPIAFAFLSRSLTQELLGQLKTGEGKLIRLADDVTDAKLRWLFLEAMGLQIRRALAMAETPTTKPASPASPSPEKAIGIKSVRHVAIRLPSKGEPLRVEAAAVEMARDKAIVVPGMVRAEEDGPKAAMPQLGKPPVADSQGVARNWRELEPTDQTDPVPHEVVDKKDRQAGWRLVGASRRGKMHAHRGIYREDAFSLGGVDDWLLMVVADGGGSCPLARVGAQLVASTAVDVMMRYVGSLGTTTLSSEEICDIALKKGMERAWKALAAEADERQVPLGHLGTTLLGVLCRPEEAKSIVGVVQIGDGLVVAELTNGEVVSLAEPDIAESAGETVFLTSSHWKDWLDRVTVHHMETPRLLAAMCDGVADDFIPLERHIGELLTGLHQKVLGEAEHPEQALLDLLAYDRRGSFDDRTLALSYQLGVQEVKKDN